MSCPSTYISSVRSIPILSAQEELDYFKKLEQGDLEAAKVIIISHLRFVAHIAKGYLGYGLSESDLIQEGNVGLMKAVKKFNPDVGVRLITFAVHWIKAEINEYIIKNWRIVKIATTKAQRKLFFNLRKNKDYDTFFAKKEINSLAERIGVLPSEVIEMEKRFLNYDACLDAPVEASEDCSSESLSLHSLVPDQKSDLYADVEQEDLLKKQISSLRSNLSALDDRSRDIIQSRWLLEKKITLKELSERYNISAERVRQVEAEALLKLKSILDQH